MTASTALRVCALRHLCGSRHADGILRDSLGRECALCTWHKQLYDFLGERRFIEKFGIWLFPKGMEAKP